LDIPVGADPAAMGAAYTALARNAYAPVWNPGGLGFLNSTQISGQHLDYLDTEHYEFLSAVHPFNGGRAIGASVQYLGSGDIPRADGSGTPTGTFSSYFASYNLAYGQAVTDKLSVGVTGKMIHAHIDDVSASAYAADVGSLYQALPNCTLAATVTNIGSPLTLLNEANTLPLAFHLGGAYRISSQWLLSTEGVYPKTGLAAFHVGGEWRPIDTVALRAGYRTDTVKELSAVAGVTAGIGLYVWGQEFAYAFTPMGDLGDTHYFSFVAKFGERDDAAHNLVDDRRMNPIAAADQGIARSKGDVELMELLNGDKSQAQASEDSNAQ